METWKDVAGYEGMYQVSDEGRVRRLVGYKCKATRILKPVKHTNGYLLVRLCKNGESKCTRIHRLVADAFIPNTENKGDVNHIDGNKTNNHVSNLEWATRSENLKHAHMSGLASTEKAIKASADSRKKRVVRSDGEVFESEKEAAIAINAPRPSICKVLKGELRQTHGYSFRYEDD